MEEEGQAGSDNVVTEFETYEQFLDSQITPLDIFYLEVSYTSQLTKSLSLYEILPSVSRAPGL